MKNQKKIIILLTVLSVIMIIFSKSYALFQTTIVSDKSVVEITTASELPTITVNDIKAKLNSNNSITEDAITYLSGSKEVINFNYVWYSGKLWRITSINQDGTMKLITEDLITAITFNTNPIYNKDAWIYQFLNEDFLDTLYNKENIIVEDSSWNAVTDANQVPQKLESSTPIKGDVGLLTSYEYYKAYEKTDSLNNYLNVGYYWWLITAYDNIYIHSVDLNGNLIHNYQPELYKFGVRPMIVLKPNLKFTGSGTKNNPYKIVGDKKVGVKGDFLNTRLSGEYVRVDNKVYRIVGIENGTTKLTSVDYVRDKDNNILLKSFGSDINYANSVASKNLDYWGYYLNNTWLTENLKKYITEGTYYLGQSGNNQSYKTSICENNVDNLLKTTSLCQKTNKTWYGFIGLPRTGEMFSSQLGDGYIYLKDMWILTSPSDTKVWFVSYNGTLAFGDPTSWLAVARPSINLKSNIIVTRGYGTKERPYELSVQ